VIVDSLRSILPNQATSKAIEDAGYASTSMGRTGMLEIETWCCEIVETAKRAAPLG
jgi:hypothetical protein